MVRKRPEMTQQGFALYLLAALMTVLSACSSPTPAPAAAVATPAVTPTAMAPTTPSPEPAPVVLGDCQDGMRLQPGEGCRYMGGGNSQAEVVLSVQHDGAICREGGPAEQFGLTMDNLRICLGDGFERDDAFQSEVVASASADGSWTFYESRQSALRATPSPEPAATPGQTAVPTPGSQGDGRCSAGMIMREGDYCTVSIPGVNFGSDRFEIRDGSGCYGNVCSGGGVRLNDFIASRNSDGSWTIERVPGDTPEPAATRVPMATPTATPVSTPEPTATPAPTATPTPMGPAVEVSDIECGGEQITLTAYRYWVTGEVHANQDIYNVQVGFGENSFIETGIGTTRRWTYSYRLIYSGDPTANLGSMSAGESKLFELSFGHVSEIRACRLHVVWDQRPR